MAALVADFDSGLTNTLTFGDFIRLMGAHDFDAPLPTPRLPFGLYEVTFIKPSLGMKIARVLGGRAGGAASMASVTGSGAAQVGLLSGAGPIEGSRGSGSAEITVLSVSDAALAELVEPGDVIVAVNGAPLNVAGDDVRVLASKLGPLQRPVRVTFAMGPDRYRRAVAEAAAVSAAAGSPSHPGDHSRNGNARVDERASVVGHEPEPHQRLSAVGAVESARSPADEAPATEPAAESEVAASVEAGAEAEVARGPRLHWRALRAVGDLEKLKALRARLAYFQEDDASVGRGGGSRIDRVGDDGALGSLSGLSGLSPLPPGAAAVLIEAGKLCLKLVKRGLTGRRLDTRGLLRLSCCLLDRALVGSHHPGAYPARSGRPTYSPNVPTARIYDRGGAGRGGESDAESGSESESGRSDDGGIRRSGGGPGSPSPAVDGEYWCCLAEAHWLAYQV
jgi:hypothetical protein